MIGTRERGREAIAEAIDLKGTEGDGVVGPCRSKVPTTVGRLEEAAKFRRTLSVTL